MHFFVAVPSVPRGVTAFPAGPRTLVVTWMQPLPLNAPTVNYTVLIEIAGETSTPEDQLNFTTGFDVLSFIVRNLRPFTNYSVVVVARSEAGFGGESAPIYVVTIEEGM